VFGRCTDRTWRRNFGSVELPNSDTEHGTSLIYIYTHKYSQWAGHDLISIDGVDKYAFTEVDAGDLPDLGVSDDDAEEEEKEEEEEEEICWTSAGAVRI
jgi:hypothetical protein